MQLAAVSLCTRGVLPLPQLLGRRVRGVHVCAADARERLPGRWLLADAGGIGDAAVRELRRRVRLHVRPRCNRRLLRPLPVLRALLILPPAPSRIACDGVAGTAAGRAACVAPPVR